MNNIKALEEELARNEEALQSEPMTQPELTEDEKRQLAELEGKGVLMVNETSADGEKVSIPIKEYASKLDQQVIELKEIGSKTDEVLKTVHSGDIKKTVDEAKQEAKDNAIRAFRNLSVTSKSLSEDDILACNNAALAALQEHLHIDKFSSDELSRMLRKMTVKEIVAILPPEFVNIYLRPSEVESGSAKVKEKLVSVLAYLSVTGPEMDYLNEYIENEHKLMDVSNEVMHTHADLSTILTDDSKMSEIVERAYAYEPKDDSFWSKVLTDPKHMHNEFAQKAVIMDEYRKAYEAVMQRHLDDNDQVKAIIQEQIDESVAKHKVYRSVLDLETMKKLWPIIAERHHMKKFSYDRIYEEAKSALERIRKAKQNVPFPIFDPKLAKRPNQLFGLYMEQYPKMLMQYNTRLLEAASKVPAEDKPELDKSDVEVIAIDGYKPEDVYHYFSLYLLILFGRIMKKLGDREATKYDAIELDAYFTIYCKLGSDIYLMTEVWNMIKDMIAYAITNLPRPETKPNKNRIRR